MPSFAPKHGVPYTQDDADVICPEILSVVSNCGGAMDKDDIVAAARKRGSPLRDYVFDKKEKEAAHQHYRTQAGKLLRSFDVIWVQNKQQRRADLVTYVEILPAEDDEEEARGARRINTAKKKGYVSAQTVLSEEAYQQQIKVKMQQQLAAFRRDYAEFQHLVDFRTKFGRVYRSICQLFDKSQDEA